MKTIIILIFIFNYINVNAKITYNNISGVKKPPFLLYSKLKDECYRQNVKNKEHCIKTGLSIAYAESSWKDLKTPFGLKSNDKSYKKFVSSYKKYWYKAYDGGRFYGINGKQAPTRYCTEEESSNTIGWCPNGRKNFNKIFFNIYFK